MPSIARAIEGCGEQPNTAPALQPPRLLTDWAWLGRYRQANAELTSSGAKVDAVFLGDSITEGWTSTDPGFFAQANIGRGISAQTTPQLLVRMHADVIALKPRVVHIMAGTNDIAQNTGPMSPEDSKNNFMAMCEIARAHRIRVVLGSVPPASKYGWRPDLEPKAPAIALNDWMRAYAREIGAVYADYAAAAPATSATTKPAYCISYDEGSCIARCHGSNAASAALPACPPQCTPGNATEPPTCRIDAACEATMRLILRGVLLGVSSSVCHRECPPT